MNVRAHFSWAVTWVRFGEFGEIGFSFHTPLSRPLFSERYGLRRPLVRFLGFRVFRLDEDS